MFVYVCVYGLECLCNVARHVVADITSRPDALSHFAYFNLHAFNIKQRGFKRDKRCPFEYKHFLGNVHCGSAL